MPDDAIYHRTLSLANIECSGTYTGPLPYTTPYYPAWTQGYWLSHVLSNYLEAPVPLWIKPDQKFEDYATQFEKDFSSVLKTSFRSMRPIIDSNPAEVQSGAGANGCLDHEVIAHLGWVNGPHVHVPSGSGSANRPLRMFLEDNTPVWVAKASPSGYRSYDASETRFLLGTDIDGRVLWYLNFDVVGAESSSTSKQVVGKAVTTPVRKAAGVTTGDILKSVARRILFRF